jgi:hypothetical protein
MAYSPVKRPNDLLGCSPSSRVAIWVAVHGDTAQFNEVRASSVTCGASAYEPRRIRVCLTSVVLVACGLT